LILSTRKSKPDLFFHEDKDIDISWKDILLSSKKENSLVLEERKEQGKMLDIATEAFIKNELVLIEKNDPETFIGLFFDNAKYIIYDKLYFVPVFLFLAINFG
jgi:hypothetical protein